MSENLGKPLPRAKPITMTFYDSLQIQPYTSTFYVREDTSEEECQKLIRAVEALSMCVLGKYKIGYQEYVIPDYQRNFATMSAWAIGTAKWQISYHTTRGSVRRHTIPGRNPEHGPHKIPDPNHPLWVEFLEIFRNVCVSKEGESISGPIELGRTGSNWPPKSAKQRRKRKV
jgi:hypothetical protein